MMWSFDGVCVKERGRLTMRQRADRRVDRGNKASRAVCLNVAKKTES